MRIPKRKKLLKAEEFQQKRRLKRKKILRSIRSLKKRTLFRSDTEELKEKAKRPITGILERSGKNFLFFPEDKEISPCIVSKSKEELKEGSLALCQLTSSGCEVIKVFPRLSSLAEIKEFLFYKYGLPRKFKKRVEEELRSISREISFQGRLDLTSIPHVTIDGENAKDFDDAVYVEKRREGYRLYVSIADVSEYVRLGSELDSEAKKRGMSIYFPDSVIPMLPPILSDDLCSLRPMEERACFTVIIDLTRTGDVIGTSFVKSVIRSVRRLTYEEVERAIIERDKDSRRNLKGLLRNLEHMRELTEILLCKRRERGSLDFDLPEPEVVLDMEGGIKDIVKSRRLFSHRIIEEFMVLANSQVAEFFVRKGLKALFRVHEEPDPEKLRTFEKFAKFLNLDTRRNLRGIKRLQEILEAARGKPYETIVNRLLLRSMKQARYSAKNLGHYGLGLDAYLHFTSPIRRYPDLVCHRILEASIARRRIPYSEDELEEMARYLSERERLIMEVERETEDRVRVLFMRENIGEEYEGIITHIASFGFFVELTEFFVEGVVFFSDLADDFYKVNKDGTSFSGRRRRMLYRLGDLVRVKVIQVDVERKVLRLLLIGKVYRQ